MRAFFPFVISLLLWAPTALAQPPDAATGSASRASAERARCGGRSESGTSHLARTQLELARSLRQANANPHDRLLQQARRVLAEARRAVRDGHPAQAERALDIADAALILWNARRDREQARAAASAAERRATAAETRLDAARQALTATRAKRRAHDRAEDAGAQTPGDAEGGSDDAH